MGRRTLVQKGDAALLALAEATAVNSATAAANQSSTVNGAAFTGVATVNFSAPPITHTTGKRFLVSACISGLASAVDLTATVTLQEGGVNISNSATMVISAGHVTANMDCSLFCFDETIDVGPVTYSVNLVMASGTITVGVGQVNITVQELN